MCERAQNSLTPPGVRAAFHGSPGYESYVAAEDRTQLVLHAHEVEQAVTGSRCKRHQHVHVTIGPDVVPQHRTEERKLQSPAICGRRRRWRLLGWADAATLA